MKDEHATTLLSEWEFAARTKDRLTKKQAALAAAVREALETAGTQPSPELLRVARAMELLPPPTATGQAAPPPSQPSEEA